jgi:D-amino peptidase
MKRIPLLALGLCLIFGSIDTAFTQPKKLKIYISVDMEGIVGVVSQEQLGPTGFEYNRFREFMTNETNAAIEAAFEAGATEIVVSDSHGNGQNILIEKLNPRVTLVRSWPRPLAMMQGIDETFDGAIFIGYHSSTTNMEGVRAHTMSSARFADVKLNGTSVPEAGLNAAIAGHFNVPVIMISGDDVIVKEAQAMLGNIEGAAVKEAIGFHSAKTLMPDAAYALIRAKVTNAMARLKRPGEFKPYKIKEPTTLDLRFKNYRPSEILAYLSIVQRTDSHSIRFIGKDILEVTRFLEFVTNYESTLEP